MEKTVTKKLDRLKQNFDILQNYQLDLLSHSTDISESRKQTLRLSIKNTKNRINSLEKEIKNYILGEIYEVSYRFNYKNEGFSHKVLHARLTNLQEDEIHTIFDIFAEVFEANIEILEIKKLPTYICDDLTIEF